MQFNLSLHSTVDSHANAMGVIVGDAITKFYFVITYRWIALRFKGEIIQMALLLRSQIIKSIHRAKPLAVSLLLGFCVSATATDPNDRVLTYSVETDVLVSFKLLPRQNEVGRDNAIYDNNRP